MTQSKSLARFIFLLFLWTNTADLAAQKETPRVITYYRGSPNDIEKIPLSVVSHVIFSVLHLKGNKIAPDNANDSLALQRIVDLKKKKPSLRVSVAFGGWGGCASCSELFSSDSGRTEFALSVLSLSRSFGFDGLDIDWEYPAISGYEGHSYKAEDKANFTKLVMTLRQTLGEGFIISFAAGAHERYLENSVEWKEMMQVADYVNLMTYDFVGGSAITGHHTNLYSTSKQVRSADYAVNYLLKQGVPREKINMGAAFYGKLFENVENKDRGLYQPGNFSAFVAYHRWVSEMTPDNGYVRYWDAEARAPYMYNAEKKMFMTYDDEESIQRKAEYVLSQRLGGIMIWQIRFDVPKKSLTRIITKTFR